MCVCIIYMCVCVCVYTHTYTCMYTYICRYTHIHCMYTCNIHTHMSVYIHTHTCIHTHVVVVAFSDYYFRMEGLPRYHSIKEFLCQCKRCKFNSWVRMIPWRTQITHSSILAWKIPCIEKPGRLQSMGLQKSQTWLMTKQQQMCIFTYIHCVCIYTSTHPQYAIVQWYLLQHGWNFNILCQVK